MKISISTMVLTFLICMLAGCRTTQVSENPNYSNETRDAFVLFLKKQLPLVHRDMTFKDVDEFLQFKKRFKGIVTSEGKRSDFKYYYQLIGYQLILTFDYAQDEEGKFISYQLKPLS